MVSVTFHFSNNPHSKDYPDHRVALEELLRILGDPRMGLNGNIPVPVTVQPVQYDINQERTN